MRICYTEYRVSDRICNKGENKMIHATIKEIGENAVSEQEPILILFDRTATTTLRNYSVIQKITSTEKFSLKKGDSLFLINKNIRLNMWEDWQMKI